MEETPKNPRFLPGQVPALLAYLVFVGCVALAIASTRAFADAFGAVSVPLPRFSRCFLDAFGWMSSNVPIVYSFFLALGAGLYLIFRHRPARAVACVFILLAALLCFAIMVALVLPLLGLRQGL